MRMWKGTTEKSAEEKLANIILLGNKAVAQKACPDVNLDGITFVNPVESENLQKYADFLLHKYAYMHA